MGLPIKTAVGILYFSGICLGWLGLVISRSGVQVGFMLLGFVLALALFFGFLLWNVPVYKDDAEAIQSLEEMQQVDQTTFLEYPGLERRKSRGPGSSARSRRGDPTS
jgi:hypothetical protein